MSWFPKMIFDGEREEETITCKIRKNPQPNFYKRPLNSEKRRHFGACFSEFFCNDFLHCTVTFFLPLVFSLLVIPISLCETKDLFSEENKISENHKISPNTAENLYDKMYVISLDRTPERYVYVKNQLDRLNLKHERFSAVDGNLITVKDVERNQIIPWQKIYTQGYYYDATLSISQPQYEEAAFFYKHNRYTSNLGEFGCAMSHRAVWADVVKHNYKKAIIFEDDVTLEDDFLKNFSQVMNNLPNDFDVFFLDIAVYPQELGDTRFFSSYFWLSKFSNTSSPYCARIKAKNENITSTHAYVITCDSAKKLLEKTKFMNIPIDNSIILSGLKLYVSKIKLLSPTLKNSVIRGDEEK